MQNKFNEVNEVNEVKVSLIGTSIQIEGAARFEDAFGYDNTEFFRKIGIPYWANADKITATIAEVSFYPGYTENI